ncbi:MAG TPA: nucleotidyltransferase family protein [Paracoccaceae bacterium]|nr:nucleotidyltransferase family protein [Paracoccaceae bacterium]
MTQIAILILAAGGSTRMGPGRDKLLEAVAGQPLLARAIGQACATGAQVFVALPGPDHPRTALRLGSCAQAVYVADAAEGMAASIRAGVAALPAQIDAVMILPADMPEVTGDDLQTVMDGFVAGHGKAIAQACSDDGRPGHPVIFPRRCFAALTRLSGDRGAKSLLAGDSLPVRQIPLPAAHALTDLDTPQDWADWRRGQPG